MHERFNILRSHAFNIESFRISFSTSYKARGGNFAGEWFDLRENKLVQTLSKYLRHLCREPFKETLQVAPACRLGCAREKYEGVESWRRVVPGCSPWATFRPATRLGVQFFQVSTVEAKQLEAHHVLYN